LQKTAAVAAHRRLHKTVRIYLTLTSGDYLRTVQTVKERQAPVAMTVAGSDSGGMVGMQADMLTFAANGVYGVAAMTCVTAQTPEGIAQVEFLDPDFVIKQAEELGRYFPIKAAKTGLLFKQAVIEKVADFFSRNSDIKLVVDPVMVASNGDRIISEEAIEAYKERLLPLATVITPNLDEAEILAGRSLDSPKEFADAAKEMSSQWGATVYLKGGHLKGQTLYDVVHEPEGESRSFTQERIQLIDTRGSGCSLSACVASQLAKGSDAIQAIEQARKYLRQGMERPVYLSGKRFINHFPNSTATAAQKSEH